MTDVGMQKVDFEQGADIYVINTCSVTDNADKKCRKIVNEALRYNRRAAVVVIGCYAQLKPREISEIPGVAMVLGANEKFNLVAHLSELELNVGDDSTALIYSSHIKETNVFIPGFSVGDRTRSFLKVQDGCDYFCSFCTIPLARGKSRSSSVAETLEVAREVAATNVKEVVLTGVNIGDFGAGTNESFYDLVRELDKIEGIDRFRISSIEPNLLTDEIIDFVASSQRFVPHFHIPLQSGNDELLKKMRRKYLSGHYASRIAYIRKAMPGCAIGVDVIVGFPGETEEKFLETYRFLQELDVAYFHVFPYSERANTTARKMTGAVPQQVRTERSAMLRSLSAKKRRYFYEQHVNEVRKVLFEAEPSNGMMHGFTDNYIKVEMPYDPLLVNEIVPVQLEGIGPSGDMLGDTVVNTPNLNTINTYA